eukprot:gene3946-14023_t
MTVALALSVCAINSFIAGNSTTPTLTHLSDLRHWTFRPQALGPTEQAAQAATATLSEVGLRSGLPADPATSSKGRVRGGLSPDPRTSSKVGVRGGLFPDPATLSEVGSRAGLSSDQATLAEVGLRGGWSPVLHPTPSLPRYILPTRLDKPHLPYVVGRFSVGTIQWEDLAGNQSRQEATSGPLFSGSDTVGGLGGQPIKTGSYQPHLPYVVGRFSAGAIRWEDLAGNQSRQEGTRLLSGAMFHENDYGMLADYQVCSSLNNPCVIHASQAECMDDNFCGWCPTSLICLDKWSAEELGLCPKDAEVFVVQRGALQLFDPELGSLAKQCSVTVMADFQFPELKLEEMFYHLLLENLGDWVMGYFWSQPPTVSEKMHYLITKRDAKPKLFFMFGLLSKHCYRAVSSLPDGLCLVQHPGRERKRELTEEGDVYFGDATLDFEKMEAMLGKVHPTVDRAVFEFIRSRMVETSANGHGGSQSMRYNTSALFPEDRGLKDLMRGISNLKLHHLSPKDRGLKDLVGGISNLKLPYLSPKRFILNIEELLDATLALGVLASIMFIDELKLHEVLSALADTTIFVGLHGSGLANMGFLPVGGSVLEILPGHCEIHGVDAYFASRGYGLGIHHKYLELGVDEVVPKWEYKPEVVGEAAREAVLQAGITDWNDFYTFWLNMDFKVDVDKYILALQDLLAATPVHEHMHPAVQKAVHLRQEQLKDGQL